MRSNIVSFETKATLLPLLLKLPGVKKKEMTLRVQGGSLSFFPAYYPDFATFRDIYLRQVYRTDYRGASVLDLGAHKGYFTNYAAQLGAAVLICYEPEPANYASLTNAVSSRPGDDCQYFLNNAAIAAENGEAKLHVSGRSWSHSLIQHANLEAADEWLLETVSFEDAIRSASDLYSDRKLVVKMDIEGMEYDSILATSVSVLASVSEIFVEVHDFVGYSQELLIDHLLDAGFERQTDPCTNVLHFVNRDARRVT